MKNYNMRVKTLFPYILIFPSFLAIILLLAYPIIRALIMSVYEISLFQKGLPPFIGLDNYRNLLMSSSFWNSVRLTGLYTLFVSVGAYALGLFIALLIKNLHSKIKGIVRTIIIIPWAIPSVVAVISFRRLFDYQYGLLNSILFRGGFVDEPIGWILNPQWALVSVIIISIWKLMPIPMLMILSALQGIPQQYYDAASIDGASKFKQFMYITLPSLRSITGMLYIILMIWAIRYFTIIFLTTGGGPARATETLSILTYVQAFRYFSFGTASAVGTLSLSVTLLLTFIYLFILKPTKTGGDME